MPSPRHGLATLSLTTMALATTALATTLLAFAASAGAQVSAVGGVVDASGASALLRTSGVRDGAGTVDAWARVGTHVAFGVTWRYAHVFGALGNVIVEGGTDLLVRVDDPAAPLGFRAALGARGVLGPVAASLRLDGGTVAEDELDATIRAEAPRSALGVPRGAWDAGARFGATYRIDRATVASFEPRVRLADGRLAASAALTLRRSGLRDDLDLWLGLEGSTLSFASTAAVGAGVVWTRRREPDSWLRLWLGSDGVRVHPGVEALVSTRTSAASWSLGAAWVPHRLDAHAWRIAFDAATAATAPGSAIWRTRFAVAGTASRPPAPGAEGSVTFSLALALERPHR